jgi:hypothetical protein
MKTFIALALLCALGLLTGCEHEHYHHRYGGAYGRPAPVYQYGTGGYYNRDHDWDRR